MNLTNKLFRSTMLMVWSLLLSSLTLVFGGIPLNAHYRQLGRGWYWVSGTLLIVGLFLSQAYYLTTALAVIFLLVGLFNEQRRQGASLLSAGFVSVFFVSASSAFFAYFYAKWAKFSWSESMAQFLKENVIKHLPPEFFVNTSVDEEIRALVLRSPSVAVIGLICVLFFAVLVERRLSLWSGDAWAQREKLRNFRIPDMCIWIFAGSLLAAFYRTEHDWLNPVGANVLNLVVFSYFLQGLAVIATYFYLSRTSFFWRNLFYVLVVTQLFLAVAALGILDFWFDFRARLTKRSEEFKKLVRK